VRDIAAGAADDLYAFMPKPEDNNQVSSFVAHCVRNDKAAATAGNLIFGIMHAILCWLVRPAQINSMTVDSAGSAAAKLCLYLSELLVQLRQLLLLLNLLNPQSCCLCLVPPSKAVARQFSPLDQQHGNKP
jgi:hypothetical protein